MIMTSSDLITQEILQEAGNLEVFDQNGTKVKFYSFFENQKSLVVFIRFFMCSSCMVLILLPFWKSNLQAYVEALSTQVDPSELAAKDIKLIIIGCGDYSLIKFYAQETKSKYPIYADPSRTLFKKFGLLMTTKLGKKPDYVPFGIWAGTKKWLLTMIKAGRGTFKAGDVKQVGGEQIPFTEITEIRFLLGPGYNCIWGHRMTATRDHVEIAELREVIGLSQENI